jgi:hypothetical protein
LVRSPDMAAQGSSSCPPSGSCLRGAVVNVGPGSRREGADGCYGVTAHSNSSTKSEGDCFLAPMLGGWLVE